MQKILSQLWRGCLYAIAIIVLTWLFFGPIAGFHHMIRCGLLCPVFLDGESPEGGHMMWGEFEVRFFPIRMALSIVLWALCLFFAMRFLRVQTTTAAVPVVTTSGRPSFRFRLGVISALALVLSGLVASFVPVLDFTGFVVPVFISVVALVCGFCSVASIFSQRGFDRTVASLCAAVSLYALLRFGSFLLMIIP
jgi:hypothetical protein